MKKDKLTQSSKAEGTENAEGTPAESTKQVEIKNKALTRDIEKRFEVEVGKVIDVDPKDEKQSNRFLIIMVSVTLSIVTIASLVYSLINILK